MSGISRLIAKELSAALGITDNPKFNPMFKQTDEVLSDVADPNDPTVARFYSPLESAIENAPIGKEGTRGENVEAFVRKRAPKVSKAEMEFRGLGLASDELYTADTAKEGLTSLNVKAVKRDPLYRMAQRQSDLEDAEVGYTELSLEADENLGFMTHFGESNIAHTRYSFRQSKKEGLDNVRFDEDPDYILIEELQSDPLQNVVDDMASVDKGLRGEIDSKISNYLDEATAVIEDFGTGFADTRIKQVKDYIYEVVIPTRLNKELTSEERADIFKSAASKLGVPESKVWGGTGSLSRVIDNVLGQELAEDSSLLDDIADGVYMDVEKYIGEVQSKVAKKDLPVTRITDTIRMSLQAIISDAKSKGINEIVLPPVEKLAEKRFSKADVSSKIAKGSAFHNTYVAAYEKVLKQLKGELGDQIKIGKKPLKYRAEDWSVMDKKYETKQGTLLDISNLTVDPTTTKLRFNKGGLVERPE